MIAELIKDNKKYTYRVKSKNVVVIKGNRYTTKQGAIKGFKRFNNSAKVGRVVLCNEAGCYHVEVFDRQNKILAESVNLVSKIKVKNLSNRIKSKTIILKDIETRKMRTYINNIGEIKLTKPLIVEVEKNDDYLLSIKSLNLFSYGDNLEETIKELKEDLIDLYDDLFGGKYKLAKPAIKLKSDIKKLLK